jgi:hypothetical protein
MTKRGLCERLAAGCALAALAACAGASEASQAPAITARVTMVQTFGGATGMTGEGVIDFGNDKLSLVVSTPSGKTETRYFGPTAYFRADGDHWTTDHVTEGKPGSATLALVYGAGEPSRALDFLRRLDPGVKAVGVSTVRGTETTQYRAVIDAYAIDRTARGFGVDAWIDGRGRVLRLRLEDRQVLTYEFHDFGVSANVQRPAVTPASSG